VFYAALAGLGVTNTSIDQVLNAATKLQKGVGGKPAGASKDDS
jgi:hypothetical protein